VIIFFAGVFCTIFSSIENGIYLAIAASAALLLYRLARAPGKFLGKANLYSARATILRSGPTVEKQALEDPAPREGFVAYDRTDLSNPNVLLTSPHPGVFVYRFSEGFNYLNSAHHLDELTTRVFNETRRTELDRWEKVGVSSPLPNIKWTAH
jgi:sodium-independent sulfate anion transporter 11